MSDVFDPNQVTPLHRGNYHNRLHNVDTALLFEAVSFLDGLIVTTHHLDAWFGRIVLTLGLIVTTHHLDGCE